MTGSSRKIGFLEWRLKVLEGKRLDLNPWLPGIKRIREQSQTWTDFINS